MKRSAAETYDRFAPIYDRFNAGNDYEYWLGEVLLPELQEHQLGHGWALDIGCGTGRAFEPLLRRGWSVWGLDVSPEMLARAEAKFPDPWGYQGRVELNQCDARELRPIVHPPSEMKWPRVQPVNFDLILALNDVVNYWTGDGDLKRAFDGMRANLDHDGGLICFDTTCLSVFETTFTPGITDSSLRERGWSWLGLTPEVEIGGIFEAELSGIDVEPHIHRLRHWPRERVEEALESAGLQCLAVFGQREIKGRLVLEEPDESLHERTIYIAGHPE